MIARASQQGGSTSGRTVIDVLPEYLMQREGPPWQLRAIFDLATGRLTPSSQLSDGEVSRARAASGIADLESQLDMIGRMVSTAASFEPYLNDRLINPGNCSQPYFEFWSEFPKCDSSESTLQAVRFIFYLNEMMLLVRATPTAMPKSDYTRKAGSAAEALRKAVAIMDDLAIDWTIARARAGSKTLRAIVSREPYTVELIHKYSVAQLLIEISQQLKVAKPPLKEATLEREVAIQFAQLFYKMFELLPSDKLLRSAVQLLLPNRKKAKATNHWAYQKWGVEGRRLALAAIEEPDMTDH